MKNIVNKLSFLILLAFIPFSISHAVTADELMNIHKATTTEMNAINTPQAGSLLYNTTEGTLFFYNGTKWKRLRALGSETIVQAGSNISIAGNGSSTSKYVVGQ